ncbi:protein SPMIP2 [Numenius arquata]|uniref:protein SPMIP2 n=1 Tax=Numenius arquata TaxID=31919 RepID=UPI003D30BFA9
MPSSSPCSASAGKALAEARVVFPGPDGVRDYRTRKPEHTHYIGATSPAIEGTSDVNYLWRPAPCLSYVSLHRPHYAGEIGWGVRELSHFTRKNLQSGAQIKRGPFRQAAEDRATHWYQNPCLVQCCSCAYNRINYLSRYTDRARQPAPFILDQRGHNTRARLAWDSGSYKGCVHPHSKWAAMAQASPAPVLPKSKGMTASKKLH